MQSVSFWITKRVDGVLTVALLSSLFFLASNAAGSEYYRKFFIGWTGLAGIQELDPGPSINNSGRAAYLGRSRDAGNANVDHIYSFDPVSGNIFDITPGLTSANQTTLLPGLQLNDPGRVLVRRRHVVGPSTQTFLETWGAVTPGQNILVRGDALFGDVDGIYPYGSINNDGDVVFAAIEGGNVLGTISSAGRLLTPPIGSLELPFPLMADNETLVMRRGTDSIRLYTPVFSPTVIASVGAGFSSVGQKPGISDNGTVIAFAGIGQRGPGVFVSVKLTSGGWSPPTQVMGRTGDGVLDLGEQWVDSNCDHQVQSGEDMGGLSDIVQDSRISVARIAFRLEAQICFLATPASGATSIYALRIDPNYQTGEIRLLEITRVAGVGDVAMFGSTPVTLTQVQVADSINSKGELVYWAAAGSQQFIVRAVPLRKPVLLVPGIFGTIHNSDGPVDSWREWLLNIGLPPDQLSVDPLGRTFADIVQTLQNAGYILGENLFLVPFDWRLPLGPEDGNFDGTVSGLDSEQLGSGSMRYGVDYLGHALRRAAAAWSAANGNARLESVDVVGHSLGVTQRRELAGVVA